MFIYMIYQIPVCPIASHRIISIAFGVLPSYFQWLRHSISLIFVRDEEKREDDEDTELEKAEEEKRRGWRKKNVSSHLLATVTPGSHFGSRFALISFPCIIKLDAVYVCASVEGRDIKSVTIAKSNRAGAMSFSMTSYYCTLRGYRATAQAAIH